MPRLGTGRCVRCARDSILCSRPPRGAQAFARPLTTYRPTPLCYVGLQRTRPLPLRQLDLELDEAWAARNSGDAAEGRATPPSDTASTSSSNTSSSNGSHQESATDGEHLGLTAWPTEDGGLTSFSYSLDLEWPEHLQSALHPRATQPSWKDLNQVLAYTFDISLQFLLCAAV